MRVAHAQLLLGNREQSTAVSRRELPFFDPLLDLLVEFEQPNGVRDRRPVLPGPLGDGVLRQMKFVDQSLERTRRFVHEEVLPVINDYWERADVPLDLFRRLMFIDRDPAACAEAAQALQARLSAPEMALGAVVGALSLP